MHDTHTYSLDTHTYTYITYAYIHVAVRTLRQVMVSHDKHINV